MGMGREEGKNTLQHRPAQHETLCQAVALYSSHRDQLSTRYRRQCTTDQSAPQIKKNTASAKEAARGGCLRDYFLVLRVTKSRVWEVGSFLIACFPPRGRLLLPCTSGFRRVYTLPKWGLPKKPFRAFHRAKIKLDIL